MQKVNWNKKLWPPSNWNESNGGQQEFVRASSLFNMNDPKFVFIHIGKNAGTSIHRRTLSPLFPQSNNSIATKEALSSLSFSDFFKFTVIRNPWDRMLSCYFYFKKHGGFQYNHETFFDLTDIDFTSFLKEVAWDELGNCTNKHWINQDLMTHDLTSGHCWVDFFIRFENIDNDWLKIKKELGIDADLPHSNRSRKNTSYKSYYSNDSKKIVEKIFEKEIDLFKFSY